MNWIITEARKQHDPSKDRVILENPVIAEILERTLINEYYPFIVSELEKTSYPYAPRKSDLEIKPTSFTLELGRELTFMLLSDSGKMFFRGTIQLDKSGFMLKRTFFIDLPEETSPNILFRFLGDERFLGIPPTLEIQGLRYIITLEAGSGFGFTGWSLNAMAKTNIASIIRDSAIMYENSLDGFTSTADVERFLQAACRSYGVS